MSGAKGTRLRPYATVMANTRVRLLSTIINLELSKLPAGPIIATSKITRVWVWVFGTTRM